MNRNYLNLTLCLFLLLFVPVLGCKATSGGGHEPAYTQNMQASNLRAAADTAVTLALDNVPAETLVDARARVLQVLDDIDDFVETNDLTLFVGRTFLDELRAKIPDKYHPILSATILILGDEFAMNKPVSPEVADYVYTFTTQARVAVAEYRLDRR